MNDDHELRIIVAQHNYEIKRLLMIRLSSDSFPQLQWTGSWRVRGLQRLSLPFTSNEEAVMLHLSRGVITSDPESLALAFDELASLVDLLPGPSIVLVPARPGS